MKGCPKELPPSQRITGCESMSECVRRMNAVSRIPASARCSKQLIARQVEAGGNKLWESHEVTELSQDVASSHSVEIPSRCRDVAQARSALESQLSSELTGSMRFLVPYDLCQNCISQRGRSALENLFEEMIHGKSGCPSFRMRM